MHLISVRSGPPRISMHGTYSRLVPYTICRFSKGRGCKIAYSVVGKSPELRVGRQERHSVCTTEAGLVTTLASQMECRLVQAPASLMRTLSLTRTRTSPRRQVRVSARLSPIPTPSLHRLV